MVANVIFLLLNLAAAAAPAEPLLDRVRDAFARGALAHDDYLPRDTQRGFNQFNDCLILLYTTNRSGSALERAVGPPVLRRDANPEWRDLCLTLDEFASGDPAADGYHAVRYTRYWHGFMPVTTAMLAVVDLPSARRVLVAGTHLSLLLLLLAAGGKHRGLLLVAASVATIGLLFWGLPHFGQGLSHAPGDIVVLLGLAALMHWRHPLVRQQLFIPFCGVYGATVVYLEFLTAQLPIASGLLFAIAYVVGTEQVGGNGDRRLAWRFAVAGLGAFAFGSLLTVALKQGLVLAIIGGGADGDFAGKLQEYTGLRDRLYSPMDRLLVPLFYTLQGGRIMVYGSKAGTFLLYAVTTVAWVAASALAFRSRDRRALPDLLAFVFASAGVALWISIFPVHTVIHNHWMSRMLLVPIGLGWGGLLWQLWLQREHRARDDGGHRPELPGSSP